MKENQRIFNPPYSLLETERMEEWLSGMAEQGYWPQPPQRFSGDFLFEERGPAACSFSIGRYPAHLSEKRRKMEEFRRFCREWEALGWSYLWAYGNLAVFYSEGEERPPEPERKGHQESDARLQRQVIREENRQLLKKLFSVLVWPFLLLELYLLTGRRDILADLAAMRAWDLVMFWGTIAAAIWMNRSSQIAGKLRQLHVRRCLARGLSPAPVRENEGECRVTVACCMVCGAFLTAAAFFRLAPGAFRAELAALGISLLLGLCLFFMKYDGFPGRRISFRVWNGLLTLPLLLLLLGLYLYPFEKNYRFQRGELQTGWVPEGYGTWREVYGSYPGPEELGFGKESWSFAVLQSNLACRSETVVYREEESEIDFSGHNLKRQLRYVGTVCAELKNPAFLDLYLREKGISREKSSLVKTAGEVTCYLSEGKKEAVAVCGDRVVICFLSLYDEKNLEEAEPALWERLQKLCEPGAGGAA